MKKEQKINEEEIGRHTNDVCNGVLEYINDHCRGYGAEVIAAGIAKAFAVLLTTNPNIDEWHGFAEDAHNMVMTTLDDCKNALYKMLGELPGN